MSESIFTTTIPVTRREGNLTKENSSNTSFHLSPAKVLKTLLFIISILLIVHIFSLVSPTIFPDQIRINTLLNKFFNLNNESNFPTFYSAIQLLTASFLLFFIGTIKEGSLKNKAKNFWYFLSAVFLFLTLDEATQIHEESVLTVRNRMPEVTGYLYYAWIIPYSIIFLGIGILSLKFIRALPVTTRNLFLLSGFLFISGAVGLEIFEGNVDKLYGKEVALYQILVTVEEVLEMVSIAIFIYALLDYLAPYKIKVKVDSSTNTNQTA